MGEVKGYYVSCVVEVLLGINVSARTKEEAGYYAKEFLVASADDLRDGIKEDDIFPLAVMSTEIRGVEE